LSGIINAPFELIPTYQYSAGNGLAHIEIAGDTYHFVREERGQEFERFNTNSLDEILYRIFRDVAWSMALNLSRPHRIPGEDFRREMFKQQLMLLARLSAEWAARCAREHEEVLVNHPFVDKA